MDIKERQRPYSPEEEFAEGRRSFIHKRINEPLILENLVRKCKEDT